MEIQADIEQPLVLKKCPECGMVTTMVHFQTLRKDENLDVFQDDFYRCCLCLALFEPTQTEVKE